MPRSRWRAGASNLPGVLRLAVSAFVAHEQRALRRVLMLDDRRGGMTPAAARRQRSSTVGA